MIQQEDIHYALALDKLARIARIRHFSMVMNLAMAVYAPCTLAIYVLNWYANGWHDAWFMLFACGVSCVATTAFVLFFRRDRRKYRAICAAIVNLKALHDAPQGSSRQEHHYNQVAAAISQL